MCPACAARACRRSDETSSDEVAQWVLIVDGRQPCDRLAAARDHDLGALLDAPEMLAQAIVKITHPNLISIAM